MTRRPTPHVFAAATLIAWALFLGVLADRAELFIAVIPLAVGLLMVDRRRPPHFRWRQQVSADRLIEGGQLIATLILNASDRIAIVEILAALPPLVAMTAVSNRVVRTAPADEDLSWRYELVFRARGRFDLGKFHLRFWDRSGFVVTEMPIAEPKPVAVYPVIERIRQVPRPLQTQFSFGNYVSPRFGEGIEPGDLRPFLAGDRVRHINWQASLRRGQLYVTQFHEERNADVVLLLDALSEIGAPPYSTFDFSVRAAAALTGAYLARKDRVGLLEYGGFLRSIEPATGRRQRQAIVEALLPAATHFSYVVPQLDRLPGRILPRQALIIAITPLLDERFAEAIIDLMTRGFDVIVLVVSPVEPLRRVLAGSAIDDLALRIWALEWQATADKLRARGLMIVEWHPNTPLDVALAPLARSRPRWAARR
jgi:uncharacterized protein (DUF58 family)